MGLPFNETVRNLLPGREQNALERLPGDSILSAHSLSSRPSKSFSRTAFQFLQLQDNGRDDRGLVIGGDNIIDGGSVYFPPFNRSAIFISDFRGFQIIRNRLLPPKQLNGSFSHLKFTLVYRPMSTKSRPDSAACLPLLKSNEEKAEIRLFLIRHSALFPSFPRSDKRLSIDRAAPLEIQLIFQDVSHQKRVSSSVASGSRPRDHAATVAYTYVCSRKMTEFHNRNRNHSRGRSPFDIPARRDRYKSPYRARSSGPFPSARFRFLLAFDSPPLTYEYTIYLPTRTIVPVRRTSLMSCRRIFSMLASLMICSIRQASVAAVVSSTSRICVKNCRRRVKRLLTAAA